ncbi:hypothetical protein A9Q87_10950 [Flavobacteriales bacterium 34_180_T64]|nr:hypothetical protein A9Q87_10950 [Flavobacteriales bacterium 34_180_T64]
MKKITLVLGMLLLTSFSIHSQTNELQKAQDYIESKGEVCFVFTANSEQQVEEISRFLNIGHKVNRETLEVEAYANVVTFQQFLSYGLPFVVNQSDNEFNYNNTSNYNVLAWDTSWNDFPTYNQYVAKMNYYAATYPSICSLQSIGTTPLGRDLWVLKISDNVSSEEAEPEFLYTSSMHGNELTGYPLMIRLIDYLLTNYGSNSEVDDLVNSTEIYINPLANPDGCYRSFNNDTAITSPIRANANGQDLNRNYPDNVAGIHDNGATYQPETKAFLAFEASRDFVLSANFHGGTEVVNYPYDNTTLKHADHNYYEAISAEYATHAQNNSPSGYMTIEYDFPENPASPGVTQGSIWYQVYGGRQDYMNYYRHTKEVTIELSDTKFIPGSELPAHWNYNQQAFLDYMKQANYGFQGIVSDESGNPIAAKISISGHDALNSWITSNSDLGDYYRLIEGGTYTVTYEAPGYITQNNSVTVTDNTTSVENVIMIAMTPEPLASDDTICADLTATLTATGSGTFNWYENINDSSPVFSGANFTTAALNSTTSYFVEDVISKANVGETNHSSGGGMLGGNGRYLVFDCSESVVLNEIMVNSNQAGEIEIQLQDSSGTMLDSRIIVLESAGVQSVTLDFLIPIDTNLRLVGKELSSGLTLFRNNNANTNYPYTNGSITITNSSVDTNYYYFFYDWKINALKSKRKEIVVNVNPNPAANFTFVANPVNNGEVTFTNTSNDASSYSWDFADGSGSSSDTNPIYTFASTGIYNVELTSTNVNCGDDVIIIPVNVTVDTLGINENTLADTNIFPNPFMNSIHIKLPSQYNSSNINVELIDISGRSIFRIESLRSENGMFNLNNVDNISNGTYFIKIIDNESTNSIVKRLIKL